MISTLPGLTVEAELGRPDAAETLIAPLFLGGDLMLSQVSQLTGLEPYSIQNWVKRGYVLPPRNRRYNKQQFCRIALINMLKDCLRLDQIDRLLSYLHGPPGVEAEKRIDDFRLYGYVTRLIAQAVRCPSADVAERQNWCAQVLEDFDEPFPGAKDRLRRGLQVIVLAYASAQFKREAEQMLKSLDQ